MSAASIDGAVVSRETIGPDAIAWHRGVLADVVLFQKCPKFHPPWRAMWLANARSSIYPAMQPSWVLKKAVRFT
ncbi:hypothetical protein GAS19_00335 [Burkholderia glumae]|uniref:hypothetical protein n=1 Tax=Burkholderia glumae TaxID=337 RepID=UPI0011D23E98|nr:hypothetical protein [Burkholderia glumae]QGA36280.1 hypothetical protein GAS19_00335 [Burkholderia glumae]